MGLSRLIRPLLLGAALLGVGLPSFAQAAVQAPNPVTTPTTQVLNDFVVTGTDFGAMGSSATYPASPVPNQSMSNPGAWFKKQGVLYILTANATSATGGNVLTTYTLLANSLLQVGDAIEVRIQGVTAANANTKAVVFNFGSTAITLLSAASNAKDFYANIQIIKTGANTQQINVAGYANGALLNALSTTSAQVDTANIAVSTQLSTATANADATLTGFTLYGEP